FPEAYGNKELAGQPVEFDVKVKELRRQVPAPVDDELAKGMGLDDLDALKKALREEFSRDYASRSRGHAKRALLDILAERHDFAVPRGMLDLEFDAIWKQIEQGKAEGKLDEDDKNKTDDELKAEYRGIAERRVRLGLLLSEVGQRANISVTQEDLNRALMNEARRFPGQEHLVFQYYQKNQDAMNSLRAPIYEDKVIDHILGLAKVTDKPVPPAELMTDPGAEA
ncbi:MAG: trigger factor, partial [Alphaproteobacteria bacterium]|nr:trigger factor [Alphaproteobacteria bacterium]